MISAVGIVGNVEGLGLEELGVKIDRTHVVTDEFCRTGVDGLFAIGDIAGAPWLAHKASHEGVMVAELIAGKNKVHPVKPESIAGCTYCYPQVASVGYTEAQAKEKGYKVKVGRFPFIGNGKAIALGEAEGFVKTIFDEKTGELLGAHMIGAEVTELIQGYVVGASVGNDRRRPDGSRVPASDVKRNECTKACSTPTIGSSTCDNKVCGPIVLIGRSISIYGVCGAPLRWNQWSLDIRCVLSSNAVF